MSAITGASQRYQQDDDDGEDTPETFDYIAWDASVPMRVQTWFDEIDLFYDLNGMRNDGRIEEGAMALLFNHNSDNYLGRVTSQSVDGDIVSAQAIRSNRQYAQDIFADVDDGIVNGISPSMRHYAVERTKVVEDGVDEWTVTDWAFVEHSVTPIPANIKAGSSFSAQATLNGKELTLTGIWTYAEDLKSLIEAQHTKYEERGVKMPWTIEELIANNNAITAIARQYDAHEEATLAIEEGLTVAEFQAKLIEARLSPEGRDSIVSQNLPNDRRHTRDLAKEQDSRAWAFERVYEHANALHEGRHGGAQEHARIEIEVSDKVAEETSNALGYTPPLTGGLYMSYEDFFASALVQGDEQYVVGAAGASEGVSTTPILPWERYVQSRTDILSRITRRPGLVGKFPIPTIGNITWGSQVDTADLTDAADAAIAGVQLEPRQSSARSEITMLANHQTRGQHARELQATFAEALVERQQFDVIRGTAIANPQIAPAGIDIRLIDNVLQRIPDFAANALSSNHLRTLRKLADVQRINEADNPTYIASQDAYYLLLDEPRLTGGNDVPLIDSVSGDDVALG